MAGVQRESGNRPSALGWGHTTHHHRGVSWSTLVSVAVSQLYQSSDGFNNVRLPCEMSLEEASMTPKRVNYWRPRTWTAGPGGGNHSKCVRPIIWSRRPRLRSRPPLSSLKLRVWTSLILLTHPIPQRQTGAQFRAVRVICQLSRGRRENNLPELYSYLVSHHHSVRVCMLR